MEPAEPHGARTADLTVRRVGGAWLVHPSGGPDRRPLLFAAGLATDPEYSLVVVDLPEDSALDTVAEAVTRAVPAGPRGLRVVFGRTPSQGSAAAGRRLAGLLGLDVVVPDGVLLPSAGGALFIGADRGRGWVLCPPEGPVRYVSRRFPKPAWDETLPDRPRPVGESVVAEPVGAGVWIHPAREDAAQHRYRGYLAAHLQGRSDAPTVVVGTPGAPELAPEDIALFWRDLPEETRPAIRLVLFGGVRTPQGHSFGETLATMTGEPVRVYNGFPTSDPLVGRAPEGEVLLVEQHGALGRPLFAREFLHLPPEPGGGQAHPFLVADHRWPLDHLPMLRPGLHRGGPDVVLEVLPAGLWIRPFLEPPYAEEMRTAPADPHHEMVLCDDSVPQSLPRLWELAEDVVRRLSGETGSQVRVMTTSQLWTAQAARAETDALPPSSGEDPPVGAGPQPQGPGAEPDRPAAHPRSNGGSTQDAAAIVALALQGNPGLGKGRSPEAVLAGLVAVRLQLTVRGRNAGQELGLLGGRVLPSATPHAVEGLALLPMHHGVVALRTDLDEAETRWYEGHREVIGHGMCSASITGNAGRTGNTDILIWSVTGHRTALLEPELPDRVLFAPKTRFEVLDVRARRGERTVVMMRELLPAESARGGDFARTVARRLEQALRAWRKDEDDGVVRSRTPDPFAQPPGLAYPSVAPDPSDATDGPAVLSERFR